MTPASSTTTSTTTRTAAGNSTTRPMVSFSRSSQGIGARRSVSAPSSAMAVVSLGMFTRLPPSCSGWFGGQPSAELAGDLLQQLPGGIAVLRAPRGVEVGLAEGGAEGLLIDVDEGQALRAEVGAQRLAEACDVGTLVERRAVDFGPDDLLEILRQHLEEPLVGEDPIAVPDMAGQRAVLLHLVEPPGLDDRERVLLALDDVGLQRGVKLVEVDRRRPR